MNERVKELRKKLKLSMQEFGSRLGVSTAAISRIESGDRSLTDQMLKSICREFNIREEWIRTGEGDMEDLPEDEDAILLAHLIDNRDKEFYRAALACIKAYKESDPKDQKALDEYAKKLKSLL